MAERRIRGPRPIRLRRINIVPAMSCCGAVGARFGLPSFITVVPAVSSAV
jgi:hypothetical protein